MAEFFYRTEDIQPSEILKYFVETKKDRQIVDLLKSRNPIVLVGSRGVGKSFLLRVAEAELLETSAERVHPVYVSFTKGALISTQDERQFEHWMLARLCERFVRTLKKRGYILSPSAALDVLSGGAIEGSPSQPLPIERVAERFENSWRDPGTTVDTTGLPTIDEFKDAVEDLCEALEISRIAVLFDEAAHIFRPEQQRQFFTLFRDLRSPYLTCNAAVYPGVTSFGETFQRVHDATFVEVERDVLAPEYVPAMREIVEKQAGADVLVEIARQSANFAVVAYASSGNPRLLLKTLARCPALRSSEVSAVIKEYYRADIWSEHTGLAERYPGHRPYIDWGRRFMEGTVLPSIAAKNVQYLQEDKKTSSFFWVHQDAPAQVKEALRLLSYTGIISAQTEHIRATRSEVGTRYAVNLGCLLSLEANPAAVGLDIAQNLTVRRMTEFGANNPEYATLLATAPDLNEMDAATSVQQRLNTAVEELDITEWQKAKLAELGLVTIRQVLNATEEDLQQAYYVGEKRARRIRNAAMQAVMEYLSG